MVVSEICSLQIRKCFSNPKNVFKSENVIILPLTNGGNVLSSQHHDWILFELKVLYFCRVVVFSSVGFWKFFSTRMRCSYRCGGELNDGGIFFSECVTQKRCEESTFTTFATEREGVSFWNNNFVLEWIPRHINENWGLWKEDCAIMGQIGKER